MNKFLLIVLILVWISIINDIDNRVKTIEKILSIKN